MVRFMLEGNMFRGGMMSRLPTQHRPRLIFPEFGELFSGFPSWASVRPVMENHIMRLEDEMKDGTPSRRAMTKES